jgi:hypothetical protein
MLAECLANTLGYRCHRSRRHRRTRAASGVSQNELRDALRSRHRSWRFSSTGSMFTCADTGGTGRGGPTRASCVPWQRRASAPQGRRGRCCGSESLHLRIRLKMQGAACSPGRTRSTTLTGWTRTGAAGRYLYGVDWGDPSHYDIVLNWQHRYQRGVRRPGGSRPETEVL